MTEKMTILVGTSGQGVLRSADAGDNWNRVGIGQGLHSDAVIRCLAVHPDKPNVIYAGSDKGIYTSDDAGATWSLSENPLNDYTVWSLAIDGQDPNLMYAGTGTPTPTVCFRSRDGGSTWEKTSMEAALECPAVGTPRVTGIAIDPTDAKSIWVGIEVDGLRHTADGGDTWTTIDHSDIPNLDIHNVAVSAGPPKTVVVVVNNDVYTSTDNGTTWKSIGVREGFDLGYPRGINVQPGSPNVIFLTLGDTTPGSTGCIMRSKNTGRNWERLPLPVEPNTAMWVVNAQPADPKIVLAGSRYGYLYRSDDGGDSWSKLKREFSEISSVLWVAA